MAASLGQDQSGLASETVPLKPDLAIPFLLAQESHLAFPFRSSIPGRAVLQSPIEPWQGIFSMKLNRQI